MIKKILLTVSVILLMYLVIRWKQRRQQQLRETPVPPAQDKGIRFAAGALLVIMLSAVAYWAFSTL
ncbi:MAG: hypothetical protein PVG66_16840 [Chromatiales bacterium]|jgi:hypothetical protein